MLHTSPILFSRRVPDAALEHTSRQRARRRRAALTSWPCGPRAVHRCCSSRSAHGDGASRFLAAPNDVRQPWNHRHECACAPVNDSHAPFSRAKRLTDRVAHRWSSGGDEEWSRSTRLSTALTRFFAFRFVGGPEAVSPPRCAPLPPSLRPQSFFPRRFAPRAHLTTLSRSTSRAQCGRGCTCPCARHASSTYRGCPCRAARPAARSGGGRERPSRPPLGGQPTVGC